MLTPHSTRKFRSIWREVRMVPVRFLAVSLCVAEVKEDDVAS
jgi:hypothetical protein